MRPQVELERRGCAERRRKHVEMYERDTVLRIAMATKGAALL